MNDPLPMNNYILFFHSVKNLIFRWRKSKAYYRHHGFSYGLKTARWFRVHFFSLLTTLALMIIVLIIGDLIGREIILAYMLELSTAVWVISGAVSAWRYIQFERKEWSRAIHPCDWEEYYSSTLNYGVDMPLHVWKENRYLYFTWTCRHDFLHEIKQTWEEFYASLPEGYIKEIRDFNSYVYAGYPGGLADGGDGKVECAVIISLQKEYNCRHEIPFVGVPAPGKEHECTARVLYNCKGCSREIAEFARKRKMERKSNPSLNGLYNK